MPVQSILLRFSYFEHDWIEEDIDGPEAAEAILLRVASEGDWFEVDAAAPDEFATLDALAERAEQVVAGEWRMPVAAVRMPLDRLRSIIADGGWTFAGGGFAEFVGNNQDTSMLVRLVRDVPDQRSSS
ncbi:hypothetical protein ACFQZ4_05955 [Catellatospora coxensis]|uniref:Uncharacterized protein n=1 Tax=Catellatospora coxensis TaxID=310354 RepID=A0A8J3KMP8_9ACTN|nr:hypothetical protein [Catellatospora coxensis]GIG05378.1 hypothetical protein Cco03nite_20780 [Catellatospora coxensis]